MKLVNLLNLACRSRKSGVKVTTIVLHATAGASAKSSISWLAKIGLSYHKIIGDGLQGDDGTVYKCVPDSKVAYHAGKSNGPGGPDVNGYSFGVSFACMDDGNDFITPAQWASAVQVSVDYVRAYPDVRFITTHALISPGRKVDPRGPVKGIPNVDGRFPLDAFVKAVNDELLRIGEKRSVRAWVR